MLKDQLTLYTAYDAIRLKCYYCSNIGHIIRQCPDLHYTPSFEKVIKKSEFSIPQDRISSNRRKNKKHLFKPIASKIKKLQQSLSNPEEPEDQCSSSESMEEEPEEEIMKKTVSKEISFQSQSTQERKSEALH